MRWKPEYALDLEPIDSQHKELFRRFDLLDEALCHGELDKKLRETMAFLSDYVNSHFRNEQDLMRTAGYPGLEDHLKLHKEFQGDVEAFRRSLLDGSTSFLQAFTLLEKMSDWFEKHILKEDQKVKAFLFSRGAIK